MHGIHVLTAMKIVLKIDNPFKSETFNKFEATKDRSPRFRAFVIFLLLLVSGFLMFMITSKTSRSNDVIPSSSTVTRR